MQMRSVLAMVAALAVLQAPGAAFAERPARDPTGRWDAREFPREQREQRLRDCADYKKSLRATLAAQAAQSAEKSVARPPAPRPESSACGYPKS